MQSYRISLHKFVLLKITLFISCYSRLLNLSSGNILQRRTNFSLKHPPAILLRKSNVFIVEPEHFCKLTSYNAFFLPDLRDEIVDRWAELRALSNWKLFNGNKIKDASRDEILTRKKERDSKKGPLQMLLGEREIRVPVVHAEHTSLRYRNFLSPKSFYSCHSEMYLLNFKRYISNETRNKASRRITNRRSRFCDAVSFAEK